MSVFYTAGYAAGAVVPMTHSRILHTSWPGTITASSEIEGFAAALAGAPDTYSFWQPAVTPASWEIDFGTLRAVDCVGIAAHQLAGQRVAVDTWDGSAWVEQITIDPPDASPIVALFAAVTTQKVRIRVEGLPVPVGVIYVGQALQMVVKAFSGLGQIDLKRRTEFRVNQSEGGNWLGRSIARTGQRASYTWSHLSDAWYAANIEPFSLAARAAPFFLAARPLGYPAEVCFGWVTADIQPERMDILDFCAVSIDVTGYTRA